MMSLLEILDVLKDDECFWDTVDLPKASTEHHKKGECLKSVIRKGKAYLLGGKWTQEKVDKASNQTIHEKAFEDEGCESD